MKKTSTSRGPRPGSIARIDGIDYADLDEHFGYALKRAQIAWARGQGFEWLKTQNEQRNTPIVRLNEQLGYVLAPGRIRLRRAL